MLKDKGERQERRNVSFMLGCSEHEWGPVVGLGFHPYLSASGHLMHRFVQDG
jgi:hypothetical protein